MDTSQFNKIFTAMGIPAEPKKTKKQAAQLFFKPRDYKSTNSTETKKTKKVKNKK